MVIFFALLSPLLLYTAIPVFLKLMLAGYSFFNPFIFQCIYINIFEVSFLWTTELVTILIYSVFLIGVFRPLKVIPGMLRLKLAMVVFSVHSLLFLFVLPVFWWATCTFLEFHVDLSIVFLVHLFV